MASPPPPNPGSGGSSGPHNFDAPPSETCSTPSNRRGLTSPRTPLPESPPPRQNEAGDLRRDGGRRFAELLLPALRRIGSRRLNVVGHHLDLLIRGVVGQTRHPGEWPYSRGRSRSTTWPAGRLRRQTVAQ